MKLYRLFWTEGELEESMWFPTMKSLQAFKVTTLGAFRKDVGLDWRDLDIHIKTYESDRPNREHLCEMLNDKEMTVHELLLPYEVKKNLEKDEEDL